jgi:hypothetical protein
MLTQMIERWNAAGRASALACAFATIAAAMPAAALAQVGGGQSYPDRGGYSQGQSYSFECSSYNDRSARCDIPRRADVRMLQKLSSSPCVQGSTWGVGDGYVWVTNGCRARFQVGSGYSSNGSWNGDRSNGNRGRHRDRDRDNDRDDDRGGYGNGSYGNGGYGNGGYGNSRTVTCESVNYRTQTCNVGGARWVSLVRTLGSASCKQGESWGFDQRSGDLWVSRGCRAEFQVNR